MEDIQEIKVQTKEWSNPTAAGLVALAVACFCFYGLLTGLIDNKQESMMLIGCWLIGGFAVQIVVAFLDLKSGNHAGGNVFLFFSAFFMLTTGISMFVKVGSGITDVTIDGLSWAALSIVMILWTPAFFKKFGILSLIVLALDVALPCLALMDLGILSGDFAAIPAYALLIAGLLGIYLSSAIVVNTAFGKKIYPM